MIHRTASPGPQAGGESILRRCAMVFTGKKDVEAEAITWRTNACSVQVGGAEFRAN